MDTSVRVAIGQLRHLSEETLSPARQLLASGHVLSTPLLPGEKRWESMDLLRLRTRSEGCGVRLEAIEKVG